MRYRLLYDHSDYLGETRAFDGIQLYLPYKLEQQVRLAIYFIQAKIFYLSANQLSVRNTLLQVKGLFKRRKHVGSISSNIVAYNMLGFVLTPCSMMLDQI